MIASVTATLASIRQPFPELFAEEGTRRFAWLDIWVRRWVINQPGEPAHSDTPAYVTVAVTTGSKVTVTVARRAGVVRVVIASAMLWNPVVRMMVVPRVGRCTRRQRRAGACAERDQCNGDESAQTINGHV
jgi:hypothetical protein